MDYFRDKVVIVTGGALGIGLATCRLLGSRGAKVVFSDILEDTIVESRKEIEAEGIDVLALTSDVSDAGQCVSLVEAAVERFGRLDILINNAGVSIVSNFDECRPEVCKKLVDVNVMGAIYMTLAALDHLKQSRGHIIFLSSVSGIRAIPTGSVYSASKAFLRSLAESLRLELKPDGVHVGVISPGFTTSDPRKTVLKGDGATRPIDRPPHDTLEGVAAGIAKVIERRERERVLTPMGKVTNLLQRISPTLVDRILEGRELKN